MAVKKIKKLIKVKQVSSRGVKEGTKRGSYKKKNKFTNEVNENENVNNTVTNTSNEIKEEIKDFIPTPEGNFTHTQEGLIVENKEETLVSNFSENKSGDTAFESFINENKTNEEFKEEDFVDIPQTQSQSQNKQDDKQFAVLINGYMLLAFIDFVAPLLMIKIGGFLYPDLKKVTAKQLRLTKDQKDALKEIADMMAKFIFAKMNPVNAFIFMLAISYGENAMNALSEINQKEKEAELEIKK